MIASGVQILPVCVFMAQIFLSSTRLLMRRGQARPPPRVKARRLHGWALIEDSLLCRMTTRRVLRCDFNQFLAVPLFPHH
jgi:hypothetical protein